MCTFLIKVIFEDSLPFAGDTSVAGDASAWELAHAGGRSGATDPVAV